jgi:4-hydroxy-2-oxoheptanedioate aldolase
MSAAATDWRARIRTALEHGEPVLGTFVKSSDPAVAEILAGAGFELLVADLEHSSLTIADVATIVRAAEPFEVAVIARIPAAAIGESSRLLETGAIGVQVTDVVDPETLAELRNATSFPPAGRRSLALTHRDAGFGRTAAAAYIDQAHARLLTVAQVESRAGMAALPALLSSTHQPDVWFIGPFDLSTDLGHPGELEHPEVQAAFDQLLHLLAGADARIGVFARDSADAAAWRARGATLLLLSSDVTLLAGAARSLLSAARAALAPESGAA